MADITLEQFHKQVITPESDGGAYFTPTEAKQLQSLVEAGGLTVAENEEFGNLHTWDGINWNSIDVIDLYYKSDSDQKIYHDDIFTLILNKIKESAPIEENLSARISTMELTGTYDRARCDAGSVNLTGSDANLQIKIFGYYNGTCDGPSSLRVTAFLDGKYIRLDETSKQTLANTYNAWANINKAPQLSESFQLMPDFIPDHNLDQGALTEKTWSGITAFWSNESSAYILKSQYDTLRQNGVDEAVVSKAKQLLERFNKMSDVAEYEQLKADLLKIHKSSPELSSTHPLPSLEESAKASYTNGLMTGGYSIDGKYLRIYQLGIAGGVASNEVLAKVFTKLFNDKSTLFKIKVYSTHSSNFSTFLRELKSLPPQGLKLASNYAEFSKDVDTYLQHMKSKNYETDSISLLEEIKKYLAQ